MNVIFFPDGVIKILVIFGWISVSGTHGTKLRIGAGVVFGMGRVEK